jgi:nitroreductase
MATEQAERDDNPSALLIVGMSWTIVYEAIGAMPLLFVTAFLANGALLALLWKMQVAFDAIVDNKLLSKSERVAEIFLTAALPSIAQSIVLASVAVPIHRFILLDEKTSGGISPLALRTLRFVAVVLGFQAIWISAFALPSVLLAKYPGYAHVIDAGAVCIFLSLAVFVTRVSLILPSIAIEAHGSLADRFAYSWRLSGGRFWRLALSYALTILSLAILLAFLVLFVTAIADIVDIVTSAQINPGHHAMFRIDSWPVLVERDALGVLGAALGAAALSWNYRLATAANVRR